ncbi:MAG: alpha/beta hydrolase [Rhodobacter sp.]|nr:alpha/beta hydrolase [Rhodobacter sp.]
MVAIRANGLTIEVERHGPFDATPLLLIRGLGSQLIHWPNALLSGFVEAGFHVVTFDNRDAGLSQKFDELGPGSTHVYSLRDMAADAVGVLDALDIARAHVLGISMGGMILQIMALRYPARLLSAAIVMSSSRAPYLEPGEPKATALLTTEPASNRREDVIAHELRAGRAWQSPRWPFDEAERAELIGRAYDRCYHPNGTARQYQAVLAADTDLAEIDTITTPTIVIHGSDDSLLPLPHGRDIADRIPGARFVEIEGMGHDIEGDCPALLVREVTEFAANSADPLGLPKKQANFRSGR